MGSLNYNCDGQTSMFDILPVEKPNDTDSIIREILINTILTGKGFINGTKRVYVLYQSDMTAKDRAKAIKDEYGNGGGSLDGEYFQHGFKSYNAKGIEIEYDEQKQLFAWSEVEKIIHGLINSGKYLSEVEMAIYKCKVANKLGGCRMKQGKCGGYVVGVIGDTSPAPQCYICQYNYYYDPSHVAELDDDDFD